MSFHISLSLFRRLQIFAQERKKQIAKQERVLQGKRHKKKKKLAPADGLVGSPRELSGLLHHLQAVRGCLSRPLAQCDSHTHLHARKCLWGSLFAALQLSSMVRSLLFFLAHMDSACG